jgi:hypothetical protein
MAEYTQTPPVVAGRMAKDAEVQESNGRKRLRLRAAVHESGPEGRRRGLKAASRIENAIMTPVG